MWFLKRKIYKKYIKLTTLYINELTVESEWWDRRMERERAEQHIFLIFQGISSSLTSHESISKSMDVFVKNKIPFPFKVKGSACENQEGI